MTTEIVAREEGHQNTFSNLFIMQCHNDSKIIMTKLSFSPILHRIDRETKSLPKAGEDHRPRVGHKRRERMRAGCEAASCGL
jgi:hypothetical protein